ncbi:hypothetical protein Tco_1581457, partial [Tanacetum coccineum]
FIKSQAHPSSQLLTANDLVPVTFQVAIGKCNSKEDLNVLLCSKACKITSEILKKHPLKDALTLFAQSSYIYIQQLWYTISSAPNEKEVITFKIDQHEVDFTLANFRIVLRVPSPTSSKPFDQPSEFLTIASFLRKIGYVGDLDTLTQFQVKNLPQPWQTLFKVLSRYTNTKLNAYDQSKLNVLQMFYAIINQHNMDFAQLIWNDLLTQVNKKPYKLVPYPRYTKLIINHVFGTYPAVPKRFVEPHHYVYNDDPVAKMFATGAKVQEVVRLPVEFLTKDIIRTEPYQDYVEYGRLVLVVTSAEYEQQPVNTTQDLIVHSIDDVIPTK